MLATIVQVESPLPPGAAVGVGQSIPFQVLYDQPVTVSGTPVALVNVQKPGGVQATAIFGGVTGQGRILNFSYSVAAGDATPGGQFNVLLDPAAFLLGGTITNSNTLVPADRGAGAGDITLAQMNPGLQAVGATLPTPIVTSVVTVNPAVWQTGAWAALHPDYFVVRGTAGTGPLAAGQVLSVSVNGATYRADADSPQVPGVFHVDATGNWAVYIRSVGGQPATIPSSGFLEPWSTTDGDVYNVIATITDAAGNSRTDATTGEIVIDMRGPRLTNVFSTTPAGTYGVGEVLNIYVEYSEAIRVVGNPTLALNVLPQPRTAVFAGVTGNRVNFQYVVQAGDSVAALDYVNANSLQRNGGFIEDLAGNPAPIELDDPVPVLPGPFPTQPSLSGQRRIAIDTGVPVLATPFVTSLNANGTYVAGSPPVTITVTFSRPVFVTGLPRLQLNAAAGRFAEWVSGSGTNVLSFQYIVVAGDSTPDLDYVSTSALQLNGGQIRDGLGNNAVLTLRAPGSPGSLGANKDIRVVPQARVLQVSTPDRAGRYLAGQTVRIRVMFSNVVTVGSGPAPFLQLGTSPVAAVATWARYINASGNASSTATNISEFEYLVKPGDTTNGGFLNYLSTTALVRGAGMNFVWAGAATPNQLAADVTLPALTSVQNVLPNAQIVIGPEGSLSPPGQPRLPSEIIESVGSVELSVDSDGHLRANGGLIRLGNGSPVRLPNPNWEFLAAEWIDGANTVVLRYRSSGALYLWRLNSTWTVVSGDGFYPLGSADYFATEFSLGMDLNGDGIVGNPVIESVGTVVLSVDSNGHLRANGTVIRSGGNPVPAANPNWEFLAAETIGGVNTLVLRHKASGSLHLWRLNSSWAFVSGEGFYAPGSAGYFATEVAFGMDFSSDGVVGNPVIESVGTVILSADSDGHLRANGTVIRFDGNPVRVANPNWEFLAAEAIGGVNTLVLRHKASGSLSLWRLNSSWAFVAPGGFYAPGSAGYLATEVAFNMDFSGNGVVGS